MANVKLEQSQIQTAIANIENATSTLSGQLTDIYNEICNAKNVYIGSSSVINALESQAEMVKGINTDYESCKTSFMTALQAIVTSYQEEDTKTTSDVSSLENGEGTQVERPSHVPENATLGEDGRWQSTNENGQTTVYNNKGIEGTPIETDDVRLKALANQMNGGEVVQMADGRIAVRDKNGGGTIFNADGTTEAVSGATVYAGKVNKANSSGNGADPYTQELANEINKAGLSEKKAEKLIDGFETQQDSGKVSSDMSVNTDALRDQVQSQRETGVVTDRNYGPGFSDEHNAKVLEATNVGEQLAEGVNPTVTNHINDVMGSGSTGAENVTTISADNGVGNQSLNVGPGDGDSGSSGVTSTGNTILGPGQSEAPMTEITSEQVEIRRFPDGPGTQPVVGSDVQSGGGSNNPTGGTTIGPGVSETPMTEIGNYQNETRDIPGVPGPGVQPTVDAAAPTGERDPMFDLLG